MFRQTLLLLFFLSFSVSSHDLISSLRSNFRENSCLQENLISPLHGILRRIWELKSLGLNSSELASEERIDLAKQLVGLLAQAKEVKLQCNLHENLNLSLLHDDWLETAGYLFLATSNCFKDVGAELLILDSVIESFKDKNYTDGVMNTVALGLIGYQGIQDCKPLFEFFGLKRHHEELSLGEPNALGGCSVWGVVGCSAAVAAAGLACGGVDPAVAACIVAAVAALPGCGVCLCQQLNCPAHCPCG